MLRKGYPRCKGAEVRKCLLYLRNGSTEFYPVSLSSELPFPSPTLSSVLSPINSLLQLWRLCEKIVITIIIYINYIDLRHFLNVDLYLLFCWFMDSKESAVWTTKPTSPFSKGSTNIQLRAATRTFWNALLPRKTHSLGFLCKIFQAWLFFWSESWVPEGSLNPIKVENHHIRKLFQNLEIFLVLFENNISNEQKCNWKISMFLIVLLRKGNCRRNQQRCCFYFLGFVDMVPFIEWLLINWIELEDWSLKELLLREIIKSSR